LDSQPSGGAAATVWRIVDASRITPNTVTVLGFLGICAAAVLAIERLWVISALVFVASGLVDSLDGLLARHQGRVTAFGAFLDSTLDRIEEGLVLTAVAFQFADAGDAVPAAACVLTVLGSLMVSYTRARAEALGVECKVGIATRPVRVVVLSIGLVFGAGELISDVDLLAASIYAMAGLTAFTVGQRVLHVRGELKALEASEEGLNEPSDV